MLFGKSSAAKELLALEELSSTRPLSEGEAMRSKELLEKLFGPKEPLPYKRKSFRIPVDATCRIRMNSQFFECRVREVSHLNMALVAPELEMAMEEFTLVVVNFTVFDDVLQLGLHCVVERVFKFDGEPAVGIEFQEVNPPNARSQYYSSIYYPLFIDHLKELAES